MGERVLVCGDRNWDDEAAIERELRKHDIDVVIHGCARGADSQAGRVAYRLGIPVLEFPAQWDEFGRAAGPIRNKKMLVEGKPTLVLAFHEDISSSKGTANMVKISHKAGVRTNVYDH